MTQTPTPPLDGLKVIDASNMVMVPSAAVILADFGADVVKVEPLGGDLNRRGHLIPGMPSHDEEYCFLQDNRGKRSIAIDLRHPEGMAVMHRLLAGADVFLTNTRIASLRRLGLDYESLAAEHPRLIYAHGTGYGDRGPERHKPGYDAVCYWSRSGLESTIFPLEGELGPLPYGSGDHPTGMTLLSGVLMALLQRERTGRGGHVSTSLIANGAWSNAISIQARLLDATFHQRRPRADPINFAAVYYRAGCGRPFKFTIIDHQATWPRFCAVLGQPELADDTRFATVEARSRHMAEIVRLADTAFATRELDHWREAFARNDIAFSALPTFDEIVADPQMEENDVFLELEHDRLGPVRSVDNPIRLHGSVRPRPVRAPDLGEHGEEILLELGYSRQDVARLRQSGVLAPGAP